MPRSSRPSLLLHGSGGDVAAHPDRDRASLVGQLRRCARTGDLRQGAQLHRRVSEDGSLERSPYIASALINMYAKCGALEKAQEILESVPVRDVVTWSALISGYAQHGRGREALACFQRMQREDGHVPDDVVFSAVLKACGSAGAMREGREIHGDVAKRGILQRNVVVGNALVDMYAKCGSLGRARDALEAMPVRNVVTWNALIAGYAQQHGEHEAALRCYASMRREGILGNEITRLCVLKACAGAGAIERGKRIHAEIAADRRRGVPLVIMLASSGEVALGNALVDMYAKCGRLDDATRVLEELPVRNVVTWTALVAGLVQHGRAREAIGCYRQMRREGLAPSEVTLASVLKACGASGAIGEGGEIHGEICRNGWLDRRGADVLGNALLDMYARCGCVAESRSVLAAATQRSVVSWSALIAGCAGSGRAREALECYAQMRAEPSSPPPNEVTFTCVLNACGGAGALAEGRRLHGEIASRGLLRGAAAPRLGNALLDMYAKCGDLARAETLIEAELPSRGIVSWNSLIAGYASRGLAPAALRCFARIRGDGLAPNAITFVCVLSACTRSGRSDQAQLLYESMRSSYSIAPTLEHHTCLVSALAFAGRFDHALCLIHTSSSSHQPSVWLALLGACRKWGKLDLARSAFDRALHLSMR